MAEPDSAQAAHAQFTTTHWSMVLAAGASVAPAAQDALNVFAARIGIRSTRSSDVLGILRRTLRT